MALELPQAVRDAVGERVRAEKGDLPGARWTPPQNLHLTLVFLGDVEADAVPALSAALAPAFATHPPLTLRLTGAGTFPPPGPRSRPARVAWVGVTVEEGLERLRDLRAGVDAAVRSVLDLDPDRRPYSPHLTLARPKAKWRRSAVERFVAAFREPLGDAFRAEEGHLVESRLGAGPGGGALYTAVESFPLEGAT